MARYTITFRNETGDTSSSPVAGGGQAQAKQGQSGETQSSKPEWVKGLVAYNQYLKPFVSQVASHEVSTVSLRTGSDELQQKVEFARDIATAGLGIVENIAVGAAIGNLPGALIGAFMGLATTAVGYMNRRKTIGYNQALEDISIDFMNTRAGGGIYPSYSGSRGNRQ